MDKQLIAVVSGVDADEIEFVGTRSKALHYLDVYGKTGWKLCHASYDGDGIYSLCGIIPFPAYERRFTPRDDVGGWDATN